MAHTKRKPIEQNRHDTIIVKLAKKLEGKHKNYQIRMNQGLSKAHGVVRGNDTYYPDIFVIKQKKVIEIYEVETDNTINEDSIPQWKQYSSGKANFYLVVPKNKLDETKKLVKKYKISVEGYFHF